MFFKQTTNLHFPGIDQHICDCEKVIPHLGPGSSSVNFGGGFRPTPQFRQCLCPNIRPLVPAALWTGSFSRWEKITSWSSLTPLMGAASRWTVLFTGNELPRPASSQHLPSSWGLTEAGFPPAPCFLLRGSLRLASSQHLPSPCGLTEAGFPPVPCFLLMGSPSLAGATGSQRVPSQVSFPETGWAHWTTRCWLHLCGV